MKTSLFCLLFAAAAALAAGPVSSQPAAPEVGAPAIEGEGGRAPDEDLRFVAPQDPSEIDDAGKSDGAATRDERLDKLFERLAASEDKRRADRIARNIQRQMLRSGSATIDLLMSQAKQAIDQQKLGVSLDLLDAVVRLKPDYAEGWNRRATVYFMQEDFGDSLADIEQVLQLEPRHWGALSGLAMIFVQLGRNEEAVAAIDAALAVHPFLDNLKEQRDKVSKKVGGNDI